jgi:hypothetical protein
MNTTVTIGGVDYEIRPKNIRQSRAWREQFQAVIAPIITALRVQEVKLNDLNAFADIFEAVRAQIIGAPEILFDMVCSYCPDIEADRERIENEAFDDEIVRAFVAVLKVVFPLGSLAGVLNASGTGRTTSKN